MKRLNQLWDKYIGLLKPIRRTKKRVLFFVVVPIIAFTSIGIVHAVTSTIANNRAVVMFVGDSNIAFGGQKPVELLTTWPIGAASDPSANHKDNSYVPIFVARGGAGIRTPDCLPNVACSTYNFWQIKLAATFSKVKPDAIVTELGVNDTRSPGTATTGGYSNYWQKIDWFMNKIPAGKPVFWTTLPCRIEPYPAVDPTGCATVNYSLLKAPARWPNLTVLNWANEANSHPEYMQSGDVHYTDTGYAAWTRFILTALDNKFPMPN